MKKLRLTGAFTRIFSVSADILWSALRHEQLSGLCNPAVDMMQTAEDGFADDPAFALNWTMNGSIFLK